MARSPHAERRRKQARNKAEREERQSRYWSGYVTRNSNALDLEEGVFQLRDPHKIALSLKRSAEHSKRRKGTPYQSAMSMLTFYLNRAGKGLPVAQKRVLERAKAELRKAFGRA
jgi:putative cell wall-binding protein